MNTINSTAFQAKALDLATQKAELWQTFNIAGESDDRILSMMAILNSLAYCVAVKYGVIKGCKGGRTLVVENIPKLQEDMMNGEVKISIPCTHWQDYIRRFWLDVSCSSQPYLRKLRNYFAEVGNLFTFTKQRAGTTRKPPELSCVDLSRILLLYELFERELKFRGYELSQIGQFIDDDGMPSKHCGALMRVLSEALLEVAYCRGEGVQPIETLVEIIEEVPDAVWDRLEKESKELEDREMAWLHRE